MSLVSLKTERYISIRGPTSIPRDLFSIIYGHDEIKEIFIRSLRSEKPIHILLVGETSSAKSLFMSELNRLKGSIFILGGLSTKAGIRDIIESGARYIIIDELDKIESSKDLSALLSFMESGVIAIAKHKKHIIVRGKAWIFAACNKTDRLPPELLSRFLVLKIPKYTKKELISVMVKVLVYREGKSRKFAEYIAKKIVNDLESTDPRDAVKISRMVRSRKDVDKIIRILRRYR
ncbi:hypothetical protein J7L97_02570 [Candidatus Bathyarchaeota archaeon]|nr:hypothetical protein [Candidatus Bathyarchaeota archaeon]